MAQLTPNGVDILGRLAVGDSVADIARAWGVSGTLVYAQLARAREALGARSDCHAIALWLNGQRGKAGGEDR